MCCVKLWTLQVDALPPPPHSGQRAPAGKPTIEYPHAGQGLTVRRHTRSRTASATPGRRNIAATLQSGMTVARMPGMSCGSQSLNPHLNGPEFAPTVHLSGMPKCREG